MLAESNSRRLFVTIAGPNSDASTASAADAAAATHQPQLEAALGGAMAEEQRRQQQPQAGSERRAAAAALYSAAAAALQAHAGSSSTQQHSMPAAAASPAMPTANGVNPNDADEAGAPADDSGAQPESPLVSHCSEHLQHVSAMLLAMCRPAAGEAPQNAAGDAASVNAAAGHSARGSLAEDAAPGSLQAADAGQLVAYLQTAVQTLQRRRPQPQRPDADDSSEEDEAAPTDDGLAPREDVPAAAAADSHAMLLQLHLRLLRSLAPAPPAPPPALQPGSSFWAGVPTAGGASSLRRALLTSLRCHTLLSCW